MSMLSSTAISPRVLLHAQLLLVCDAAAERSALHIRKDAEELAILRARVEQLGDPPARDGPEK